jgi:hypothetical protein
MRVLRAVMNACILACFIPHEIRRTRRPECGHGTFDTDSTIGGRAPREIGKGPYFSRADCLGLPGRAALPAKALLARDFEALRTLWRRSFLHAH